jgi:hypothetical protein
MTEEVLVDDAVSLQPNGDASQQIAKRQRA